MYTTYVLKYQYHPTHYYQFNVLGLQIQQHNILIKLVQRCICNGYWSNSHWFNLKVMVRGQVRVYSQRLGQGQRQSLGQDQVKAKIQGITIGFTALSLHCVLLRYTQYPYCAYVHGLCTSLRTSYQINSHRHIIITCV